MNSADKRLEYLKYFDEHYSCSYTRSSVRQELQITVSITKGITLGCKTFALNVLAKQSAQMSYNGGSTIWYGL